MARSGWSASNWLRYAGGVLTAAPVTMACWAKTSITGLDQHLMGLYRSGAVSSADDQFHLRVDSSNFVAAYAASNSNSNRATSSGLAITANTWFHAAGVFSVSYLARFLPERWQQGDKRHVARAG